MRRALVIVGKPPQPGLVKTRLVPPLTNAGAAALYGAFLLDSVAMGRALAWERVTVVHPKGSGPALTGMLPSWVRLLEQRGHGLSSALPHAFETHLAEGFERVVLIGSDNPTLPLASIEEAGAALDNHDMSIGPTTDGGYYLIGLRQLYLEVFEGIDWSTSRVYRQTLAQAASLDLRVHSVPEWYDIDEPRDLEQLRRDLALAPASVAPATRAALPRLSEAAVYAGVVGSGGTSSVGVRPDRSA